MTEEQFFNIIKVGKFFKSYCPGVSNFYHKYRKSDGNKNPIDFTESDKALMKQAAAKLSKDLQKIKF